MFTTICRAAIARGNIDLKSTHFSVLSLSFLLSPLFFWIRFILHLFVSTILAVDCGVLSSPLNGSSSGNRTVYPNSVRLWCDSGFVLHGSWLRTCQSNGKWDGNETICEGKKTVVKLRPITLS